MMHEVALTVASPDMEHWARAPFTSNDFLFQFTSE